MVKGYSLLSDSDKKLFDSFCNNYCRTNGSVEIAFLSVRREKNYLRVDLLRNGRKTWQQVFNSTNWG